MWIAQNASKSLLDAKDSRERILINLISNNPIKPLILLGFIDLTFSEKYAIFLIINHLWTG